MSHQEVPLPENGLGVTANDRVTLESRLLDAVQQAVIATDLQGRVIYWNLYAERLFGWTREEALGRPIVDLTPHEASREEAAAIMARLLRGEPWAGEFLVRRRDGTAFTAFVVDSPILGSDGQLVAVVGVSTDVSAVRALEAQLRQAQKMEAVGRLAGGIAHDFNNLLTVILGNIELALQSRGIEPGAATSLTGARDAATRAAQLTRQMLAFSRREPLRPRVLDLSTALRGLEPMLQRLLPENIQVAFDVQGTAMPVVIDPGQYDQLVLNLAVNARDAMSNGGTLRMDLAPVASTGGAAGRHVRLAVSDTGSGISPDALPHIFEPFYTTKEPGQGTGLGLATVYAVVEQAGGHIDVETSAGHGTTFIVTLPTVGVATAEAVADTPVALGMNTRPTVLVVEDDFGLRELIIRTLTAAEFRVLDASGGVQALELLGEHLGAVDVMLTDLLMPGMDGATLAERVAQSYPGIRVIVMTGHAAPALYDRASRQSPFRIVEKPFGPAEIVQAVRRAFLAGHGTVAAP
ncbi:ATP-binding protein [Luteitalea sp.]